jgi:hypothetical protein
MFSVSQYLTKFQAGLLTVCSVSFLNILANYYQPLKWVLAVQGKVVEDSKYELRKSKLYWMFGGDVFWYHFNVQF